MTRAYNFSAGPATLPEPVLRQAQAEMLEWNGVGASIVEISHRGEDFLDVARRAEADLRTLLSIPDDYAVLFTAGGIAIGLWLFFVILYDMAFLGVLVATGGHSLPPLAIDALLAEG